MKITLLLLALLASLASPSGADTIYQMNAQGRQVVVQRDAIVVSEDSSFLVYKHFDLKDRRVEIVRLNKGTLPFSVETASPDYRRHIVDIWKRVGFKATVTDLAGKATRVFDVYLDFYPPGGRGSLLESLPPTTSFAVLMDNGSADDVEISKIDRVQIQGDHLKMTLRNGQVEEGKFLMPTNKPAEVRFLGITDQYNPASQQVFDFSLPLANIKEIRFD
ncbi:MAG: hypothetical protein ABSE93_21415 [Terriglobia bacterium]|jgi:hypothetical protein